MDKRFYDYVRLNAFRLNLRLAINPAFRPRLIQYCGEYWAARCPQAATLPWIKPGPMCHDDVSDNALGRRAHLPMAVKNAQEALRQSTSRDLANVEVAQLCFRGDLASCLISEAEVFCGLLSRKFSSPPLGETGFYLRLDIDVPKNSQHSDSEESHDDISEGFEPYAAVEFDPANSPNIVIKDRREKAKPQ